MRMSTCTLRARGWVALCWSGPSLFWIGFSRFCATKVRIFTSRYSSAQFWSPAHNTDKYTLKYIPIWTSCQGMLLLPMSPLKLHRVQWTSS